MCVWQNVEGSTTSQSVHTALMELLVWYRVKIGCMPELEQKTSDIGDGQDLAMHHDATRVMFVLRRVGGSNQA
jgi:hypothetical protein